MASAVERATSGGGGDAAELARRGIELCRGEAWSEGLYWLSRAAASGTELPSLSYAFLGYGLARFQQQPEEGLRLCRHAVELEFSEAENYELLARTLLVLGDRRRAYDAVERGLQVDPAHAGLEGLQQELGVRRRPLLHFLSRRNPVNRFFGRLRHRLLGEGGEG